ncbi:MAG: succinate dehydrogenase assembly factor 2 [Alphaproteobacteria bacterium]|nr:succinate dehydrogenase assembly factor 2 [Alphaproteobacteria bacterium]
MSGTNISSAGLDPRRRRALYRAWHRGMRETDILLGKFADASLAALSESEMDEFELLLDLPDRDLLAWLTGEAPLPRERDTPLWRKLAAFHTHSGPVNI